MIADGITSQCLDRYRRLLHQGKASHPDREHDTRSQREPLPDKPGTDSADRDVAQLGAQAALEQL